MPDDPKAKKILKEFDELKAERSVYDSNWQDVRELVRPDALDFNRMTSPGQSRTDNIYDGTAPQANEELASALHSYMSSPTERWFSFELEDSDEETERDPEAILWLEYVADLIYAEYRKAYTQHTSALHECYLDIPSFGNCILNQESERDGIVFRAQPVSACYWAEDHLGRVNRLFRCLKQTTDQLLGQFGEDALKEDQKKDKSKEWEIIHAVYPREERNASSYSAVNKRFASCWVLRDREARILKESGYDSFPYHVARWSKVAGQTYGRGPALNCLPDIRMLNRMEFTMIKAYQKACDPPLILENDGFMLPFATSPGSVNFKEPQAGEVQALEFTGRLQETEAKSEQKRESIRRAFYADWVKLMPKKERQTAYEISELVEQQLRMMSPSVGRIGNELLAPSLERTYELMHKAGRFPPAPPILQRRMLKVNFISAAARAQMGNKLVAVNKWLQNITPYAQLDPTIMDEFSPAGYATETAYLLGVSRRMLRSPEEKAELKQQREAQQIAALAAQTAEPVSEAVLNLSQANEKGNIVL